MSRRAIKIFAGIVVAFLISVYFVAPAIYQKCEFAYQQYFYKTLSFIREPFAVFASLAIGLIGVWALLWGLFRHWIITTLLISAFFIASFVVLASLNSARYKSRDARRISDIRQLQLSLEVYFDEHSRYPSLLGELAPELIPGVPVDPLRGEYAYRLGGNGNTYVLRAMIERDLDCRARREGAHPLLKDLDGEILGIQCDDPAYCAGP